MLLVVFLVLGSTWLLLLLSLLSERLSYQLRLEVEVECRERQLLQIVVVLGPLHWETWCMRGQGVLTRSKYALTSRSSVEYAIDDAQYQPYSKDRGSSKQCVMGEAKTVRK